MKALKIFIILCSVIVILNANDKYDYSYKNLDYLHLNEKQKKTIENLLLDSKDEYEEFYEYKSKLNYELENIIKSKNFDEKLYFQKVMQMRAKAASLGVKRLKKILEILDDKQKEKFAKHFKEWIIE